MRELIFGAGRGGEVRGENATELHKVSSEASAVSLLSGNLSNSQSDPPLLSEFEQVSCFVSQHFFCCCCCWKVEMLSILHPSRGSCEGNMQSNMIDVSSLREKEVPCYTSHLVPDLSCSLEGLPFRQGLSSLGPVSFSMEEAKVVPALHLPTQGAVGGGGGWRQWEEGKGELKVLSMKISAWRMNATAQGLSTYPTHI